MTLLVFEGLWENLWVDRSSYIQHFVKWRQRETGESRGVTHRRLADQHTHNSHLSEIYLMFDSKSLPTSRGVKLYQNFVNSLSLFTIIKSIIFNQDQAFSLFWQEHDFLFFRPVIKKNTSYWIKKKGTPHFNLPLPSIILYFQDKGMFLDI